MKPTGIIQDPFYNEHFSSQGCPEVPDRYDVILQALERLPRDGRLVPLTPRDASEQDLLLCHTQDYIEIVKRDVGAGRYSLSTGDTDICENSYRVALRAVGGVLSAVDAVIEGEVRNAFCPVRPPGHHAEAARGVGFCIFNNVAIGARYIQKRYGLKKVLIADWDVHHGNGTQWIFYEDQDVFYFSTHQWPSYPGTGMAHQTGKGVGKGATMNCPHAIGAGREEIIGSFRSKLAPAMRIFRPEFVLISAGFDSEAGDPLGGFCLSADDFCELTEILMDIAKDSAEGRIVSVLEGGYNLDNLGRLVRAHVATMAG